MIRKPLKVSYAYPLGHPIKVVVREFNMRAILGWLFQKYAGSAMPDEILVSERIIELSQTHQWFGQYFGDSKVEILEIGHVASSMALEFASLGHQVVGIDLRSYPFKHTNLQSLVGDFLQHNFNQKFDFIYSLSTIEHFGFTHRYDGNADAENHLDEDAFRKISDLLTDSGKVVISVPYCKDLTKSDWFRIYTREELQRKLEKHFKIIHQKYFKRENGQWSESMSRAEDPASARDGGAIFLLSKKG